MSKLTWADVKLGDVIEERSRLRGLVLRVINNGMKGILLTNGLIVERFSNSPPPLQILGRFDELGCKLDLERGGFTIPQALRELVKCLDDGFAYISDDGCLRLMKTGQAYQILQECKRTLDRCEPPKPHPLTKVRELVDFLVNDWLTENLGKPVITYDSVDMDTKLKAARRELQEYDGEVGDE